MALLTGTNTVATVTGALETALSGAGSDLLGVVGTIVPVVVPIMIAVAAVALGIKIFKKFGK